MNELRVERSIVHILDTNAQMPLLSKAEQPSDATIHDFLEKHIRKALSSNNMKTARFIEDESSIKNECEIIKNNNDFEYATAEIGNKLYNILSRHSDIPSADLICVLFGMDNARYLGIFKFNYKPSFIHHVEDSGVKIIRQQTTLPSERQKVDECALIRLDDMNIKVLEKKYEIDGEKDYYFSEMFLGTTTEISDEERIKTVNKAIRTFNKKYYDGDFMNSAELKNAVKESIEEKGSIDIEDVADKVFKRSPEMKKVYKGHLEESGIKEKDIKIDNVEYAERAYSTQRIKTDNGIEIKLPRDYYKDREKLEFVNNSDGTVNIVVKNIGRLLEK